MEWLYGLALLACPLGMGAMMWFMSKGMRGGDKQKATGDQEVSRAQGDSLEELRERQHRLAADIARREEHDASVREPQPAAKR
ncbi:MAG: hypothetical protein MSC31_11340 [Solirubrobacteraceae bacterium MAG38_C4-C5]|nr:hypothetical protein [Candidatus Siliceabacter maunaloa]